MCYASALVDQRGFQNFGLSKHVVCYFVFSDVTFAEKKLKEAFYLSFVNILVEKTIETANTKFGQVPLCRSMAYDLEDCFTIQFYINLSSYWICVLHLMNKMHKVNIFVTLWISHIILVPCGGLFILIMMKRFLEQKLK